MARERKQTETYTPEVPAVKNSASKPKAKKAAKKAAPAKKEKKEGPKKANAYMMFCVANRPAVVEENPDIAFGEVGKKLGAMWKATTDEAKDDWKKKAEAQTAKNAKAFAAAAKSKK